jgi:hypothetical protein
MQDSTRAEFAASKATKQTRHLRLVFLTVLGIWIVFTRAGKLYVWVTIVCGVVGLALAMFIVLESLQIGRRTRRAGSPEFQQPKPK